MCPIDPAATAQGHFSKGLAAHRQGLRAEAQASYERALQAQPEHFETLHLLGVLLAESGNHPGALELLTRAIRADAGQASVWSNRGNVYQQLEQWDKARQDYDRAIALREDHAPAHNNRGTVLQKLGDLPGALSDYDRAIALKPDFAEAHNNRGLVLQGLKRWEESLAAFDSAIGCRRDYAEAHFNRGVSLQMLDRGREALLALDMAISCRPRYAEAHRSRGVVLQLLGDWENALAAYEQAIACASAYAEAHYGRGCVLMSLERKEEALAGFDQAIRLKPDFADALGKRGAVLATMGRAQAAAESYEKALAIQADADGYYSHGCIVKELGRFDAALHSYDQAIGLRPDYKEALVNRGVLLMELGRFSEARENYLQVIKADDTNVLAHWNLALCCLLTGDFERGWREYEWRWKEGLPQHRHYKNLPVAPWQGGESVRDKTVYLYAEQGFGDTLQFCRYVPLVHAMGARVILEVQPPLAGLLSSLAGVDQLLTTGASPPAFDVHCPLLSLPLALHTRVDSIPAGAAYLSVDPGKLGLWRDRLGPQKKPRVGLAWSGRPTHPNDSRRSMTLATLRPLLAEPFEFISLQKEVRAGDEGLLASTPNLRSFAAELHDFSDTAALCELMDVVIGVDTSVIHLAGALGRPVWVMLPFVPDWRWLTGREDSPWYPTARLFRQTNMGDWPDVVERVRGALLGRSWH